MENDFLSLSPIELRKLSQHVYASLSFDLSRRVLTSTDFDLRQIPETNAPLVVFDEWWKVKQVGKTIDEDAESLFSSMQNIIRACAGKGSKLAYYARCRNGECSLFIGLIKDRESQSSISFPSFAKQVCPGLQLEESESEVPCSSKSHIYAITGIPSIKKQSDKVTYSTIDKFLAGIIYQNIDLLILAEPVAEMEIDKAIEKIRDFSGALEAMKSVAISKQNSTTVQNERKPKDGSNATRKAIRNNDWKRLYPLPSNFFSSPYLDEELSEHLTKETSDSEGSSVSLSIVNKNVEATVSKLDKFVERLDECIGLGAWRTGVYLISENADCLEMASAQLISLVSGKESVMEPIRKFDISDKLYDNTNEEKSAEKTRTNTLGNFRLPTIQFKYNASSIVPDLETYHGNFGDIFDNLTTILSTKELAYYINFPMRNISGVSVVDCAPDFSLTPLKLEDGISFGNLVDGGIGSSLEYKLPKQCLTRHALVAGITGSGKTNTIKSILNSNSDIPFLIIEPAKTEYVDWAIQYNDNATHPEKPINIFMPGCNEYKNRKYPLLKINPFEIIWLNEKQSPQALSHIDRLKSIFASAFPMQDILPVLMEELIYEIYQQPTTKWIGKDAEPRFGQTLFPTLNSMSVFASSVMNKRRYEEKVQMNLAACLHTRIDDLKRGWRGEMLNTIKSTDWEVLFDKPCVINLSYVGDETDKAFIVSLILLYLYEYRIAKSELGRTNDPKSVEEICKHITILEEAHRVMLKCEDMENPRYKSAMLFSNMLSEVRAYGEGLVLVDQVPTRLVPDAIKNTNLKILHRLVAKDDVSAMGEAMGLSEEQMKMVPKLRVGDCIVTNSLTLEPYWVHANKI